MKAIILAGISAIALGACTTAPVTAPAPSYEAILAAPAEFRILTREEILATQPSLETSGDVKTYVGDFLTWMMEPGHLVERSAQFMTGEPPGIPEGVDFVSLVEALAAEGHPAAQLIQLSFEPEGLEALAESGNMTARLAVEMNNISTGSLQRKIEARDWLRSRAPGNKDAAYALGSFLLSQTGGEDLMGMGFSSSGPATAEEVREGSAMLLQVAQAAPLDIMVQIGTAMAAHPGVDHAVDTHARNILEIVVASTEVQKIDAPALPEEPTEAEMDAYLAFDAALSNMSLAVEARVILADMLAKGRGGLTDVERAKALYREALEAMLDYRAYEALGALGEDMSEYDALFNEPMDGDDWWNLDPDMEGEEEPQTILPPDPPHQH